MWPRSLITALALAAVISTSIAHAEGRFDKGKMSVGLAGGGGDGFFSVAGNFGYFVMDRLRPGIALAYTWQDIDPGSVHTIESNLSLRYYLSEGDMVSPFVLADLGYVHLVHTGLLDDEFDYFSVAGGGGIFLVLGRSLGLEVTAGLIQYMGAADILLQTGIVEEDISFWWNVGFALVF